MLALQHVLGLVLYLFVFGQDALFDDLKQHYNGDRKEIHAQ